MNIQVLSGLEALSPQGSEGGPSFSRPDTLSPSPNTNKVPDKTVTFFENLKQVFTKQEGEQDSPEIENASNSKLEQTTIALSFVGKFLKAIKEYDLRNNFESKQLLIGSAAKAFETGIIAKPFGDLDVILTSALYGNEGLEEVKKIFLLIKNQFSESEDGISEITMEVLNDTNSYKYSFSIFGLEVDFFIQPNDANDRVFIDLGNKKRKENYQSESLSVSYNNQEIELPIANKNTLLELYINNLSRELSKYEERHYLNLEGASKFAQRVVSILELLPDNLLQKFFNLNYNYSSSDTDSNYSTILLRFVVEFKDIYPNFRLVGSNSDSDRRQEIMAFFDKLLQIKFNFDQFKNSNLENKNSDEINPNEIRANLYSSEIKLAELRKRFNEYINQASEIYQQCNFTGSQEFPEANTEEKKSLSAEFESFFKHNVIQTEFSIEEIFAKIFKALDGKLGVCYIPPKSENGDFSSAYTSSDLHSECLAKIEQIFNEQEESEAGKTSKIIFNDQIDSERLNMIFQEYSSVQREFNVLVNSIEDEYQEIKQQDIGSFSLLYAFKKNHLEIIQNNLSMIYFIIKFFEMEKKKSEIKNLTNQVGNI